MSDERPPGEGADRRPTERQGRSDRRRRAPPHEPAGTPGRVTERRISQPAVRRNGAPTGPSDPGRENGTTPDAAGGDGTERPFLSVVIPAYNEAGAVGRTVDRVESALASVCESHEIIVVDDGSEDATSVRLRTLARERPTLRIVLNETNAGKGHAIRDGCRTATGEYVLLMDADGDLDPCQLTAFVERTRDADVVIGSKRHPASNVSYPLRRLCLSKGYSLLVRLLFGLEVTDTQVGMKLLSWEAVDDVMPLLMVEGYAFDVELLALAKESGYDIAEAPVSLEFDGDSSIDWVEVGRIALDTASVFCRLKLLESYEAIEGAVSYARDREEPADPEGPDPMRQGVGVQGEGDRSGRQRDHRESGNGP